MLLFTFVCFIHTTLIYAQTVNKTQCGSIGNNFDTEDFRVEHGEFAITLLTKDNPERQWQKIEQELKSLGMTSPTRPEHWREITIQCPELADAIKLQNPEIVDINTIFIDNIHLARYNFIVSISLVFNATILPSTDSSEPDPISFEEIRCSFVFASRFMNVARCLHDNDDELVIKKHLFHGKDRNMRSAIAIVKKE